MRRAAISRVQQILEVVRGAVSRHRRVQVRLTEDITATIYDRPGQWMRDVELNALQDELKVVGHAAVPAI